MSNQTIKKLNLKDIQKLKKQQFMLFGFLIFFLLVFGSIIYLFFNQLKFDNEVEYVLIGFSFFIFIIFCFVISLISKRLYNDIRKNKKYCYQGTIEGKTIKTSKSGKGKTKTNYYITINGIEHRIDFKNYNTSNISDVVYIEKTPNTDIILDYKHIKTVEIPNKETKKITHKKKIISTQHKAPLRRQDVDIIRKILTKEIRSKLLFSAFPLFIVLGLVISNMQGIMVFLFPIPLVLLYQIIKITQLYYRYKKALQYEKKDIITHLVLDKITSFNSSKTKKSLKTNAGFFDVPHSLFTIVQINDEIQIHIPLYFKYPIAFTYHEKTYYPEVQ